MDVKLVAILLTLLLGYVHCQQQANQQANKNQQANQNQQANKNQQQANQNQQANKNQQQPNQNQQANKNQQQAQQANKNQQQNQQANKNPNQQQQQQANKNQQAQQNQQANKNQQAAQNQKAAQNQQTAQQQARPIQPALTTADHKLAAQVRAVLPEITRNHMRHHLEDYSEIPMEHLTDRQIVYYYLLIHDMNNDKVIDGLELYRAKDDDVNHFLKQNKMRRQNDKVAARNPEMKLVEPHVLEFIVSSLVDETMNKYDDNRDGLLTPLETIDMAQEMVVMRAKIENTEL